MNSATISRLLTRVLSFLENKLAMTLYGGRVFRLPAAAALSIIYGLCGAQAQDDRLDTAIRSNDVAAVVKLLDAGTDPNYRTAKGTPMLVLATNFADVAIAKLLLQRGADVRGRTSYGRTPLHSAAHWGRTDLVDMLLDAGADVNDAINPGKQTPLHSAVYGQQYDVIDHLVSRGANVNAVTSSGETPLLLALLLNNGDDRAGAIVALLRSEANPNLPNRDGIYPLHVAVGGTGRKPSLAAVQALIYHGASLQAPDGKGRTPEAIAKSSGNGPLMVLFAEEALSKKSDGVSVDYPVGEPITAGEKKLYTIYIPYKAQKEGLYVRLKLGGALASAVKVDSPGLVRSGPPNWHWLRIPEGKRELSFYVIAPGKVDKISHLGISTSIVDEEGEPTHASRLQMIIEVKTKSAGVEPGK
jgi:ankyrin repeat protein